MNSIAFARRFAKLLALSMHDTFGSVLGIEVGGHWTFYVQKSAKFDCCCANS